jgi:hypothetical protein
MFSEAGWRLDFHSGIALLHIHSGPRSGRLIADIRVSNRLVSGRVIADIDSEIGSLLPILIMPKRRGAAKSRRLSITVQQIRGRFAAANVNIEAVALDCSV